MLVDRREAGEENPHTQFVAELRKLHLFAGAPSTRDLARRADRELKIKVSHKTVDNALNGTRLPRWNIALIVIKLLRGNERYFQQLWMAAKAYISGESTNYLGPGEDVSAETEFLDPGDWSAAEEHQQDQSTGTDEGASTPPATARPTGTLVRRTPWLSESSAADDPAVISLIKAAFRDGVDVNRLVIDIVAHDPASAGPAVAAIAANALPKAAEIVEHLAARNLSGATQLLAAIAATDPANASALLRHLLDERGIEPLPIGVVAIRLCRAGRRYRALAKRVIVEITVAGLVDPLANRIVDFLRSNPTDIEAVAGALQETLSDAASQRAGCQLLTWLTKSDSALAAEIFLLAVADFEHRQSRRGLDDRTLIAVVARQYPRTCATLILVYALREGLAALSEDEAGLLGRLVLDLALEDPALAAELACTMATNRRKTVMRLLAHARETRPTGELLLEMASRDPKLPAGILVDWVSSAFPSVPVPPGWVLQPMVSLNPSTTVRILAAMADLTNGTTPAGRAFFITGLDRRELYELADALRPHANAQEWQSIRPLLRLGRY
jgi:hypothetical protein